jgi:hypothetical protein
MSLHHKALALWAFVVLRPLSALMALRKQFGVSALLRPRLVGRTTISNLASLTIFAKATASGSRSARWWAEVGDDA